MNRFNGRDAFRRLLRARLLAFCACIMLAFVGFTNARSADQPDSSPASPTAAEAQDGLTKLLSIFGLDESAWRLFTDGQPFSSDEREPMSRLLHVLSRTNAMQRFEWSQPLNDYQELVANPAAFRGRMLRVSGRVNGWERIVLPPEAARRFGYDHFFLVEIEAAFQSQPMKIAVRYLPSPWRALDGVELLDVSLPVRVDMIFVKTGETSDATSLILGATDRIAWFPSETSRELNVSPSWKELATHGMDVTLFSTLDAEHRLTAEDSECFYQMLWTVRRLQLEGSRTLRPAEPLAVERLLAEPGVHAGQLYRATGVARRAVRIMVEDTAIQKRLGLKHYFEVECSVSLPDAVIKLQDRATGALREYSNFPVTFCFASLPDSFPQGDQIRQEVEVEGYFLKLWSYRSQFTEADANTIAKSSVREPALGGMEQEQDEMRVSLRQLSPLLIGRSIRATQAIESQPMAWPAWILMTTIAVVVSGFVLASWLYRSKDQAYRSWRRRHGVTSVDEGTL